jgi:hypothetical protein
MGKGFLGSLSTLLAGTGLALAQPPAAPAPAAGPPVAVSGAPVVAASPYNPGPAPVAAPASPYGSAAPAMDAPPGGWGETCDAAPIERFWFSADYLLWWIRNRPLPTLVTTGPATGFGGVLGATGTEVLFGGTDLDYDDFSGGRFNGCFWIGANKCWGVEFGGFGLEERDVSFTASSDGNGNPVIVRPFIDSTNNQETGSLVSFPGGFDGTVSATSSARLWGLEGNAVCNVLHASCVRWDFLFGFRYLNFREDIDISDSKTFLPGGSQAVVGSFEGALVPEGAILSRSDHFGTRNRFYGPQIGTRIEANYRRLSVAGMAKIAFGGSAQVVDISGQSTLDVPGVVMRTANGGLLALPSNSGKFEEGDATWIPEFNVNVGYWVTNNIRLSIGYNYLYWRDVLRAPDQINRTINPSEVPTLPQFSNPPDGAPAPLPPFVKTTMWVQGITFGVELKY